jgi:hypothetical protein
MWVKRGLMLTLVLLAAASLASFDCVNAASSAQDGASMLHPGIRDGGYMWYKFMDFNANKTDYIYVEFVEVHEHTAEMVVRTGLPNLNQSEWSQHPPFYGDLDFESGDLTLVGATDGVGLSFWTNPSAHVNATNGFPLDNEGYRQVDCFVVESEQERSWYDKATGVLIETSFLTDDLTTGIVILYTSNIPVGQGAANQWVLPLQIPADTMTYATVLIGLVAVVAVVAVAAIVLVRSRRKRRTAQGVLAKRCPSCGSKNRDDAAFCSRCRGPLAAPSARFMKPEFPVSVAPAMRPELYVTAAPVTRAEPPVSAVTPPRGLGRTTVSPGEMRNVCTTCGHVNPEWISIYCVRCGARLTID